MRGEVKDKDSTWCSVSANWPHACGFPENVVWPVQPKVGPNEAFRWRSCTYACSLAGAKLQTITIPSAAHQPIEGSILFMHKFCLARLNAIRKGPCTVVGALMSMQQSAAMGPNQADIDRAS
jgi:hypothetical protein